MRDTLIDAIAILTDWRLTRSFQCQAIIRGIGEAQNSDFELRVRPNISSYRVVEAGSGRIWSYDDMTRARVSDGVLEFHDPHHLNVDPLPVRLAFPLSLPIWGRRLDQYRMVSARRSDAAIVVQIAGKEGELLQGEIEIDTEKRLAVRLDLPNLKIEYKDVRRDVVGSSSYSPASWPLG